jgi:glycosyltransferase involved in cell wall biosynthesis
MFSVVIPLFDKRDYIQRALDSVYAQSIEPAAVSEILVVNDGSTDGGDAVARRQADARVRVIDQPNGGVSAARNAGIAAAGQPFIAFLDADDRWLPRYLERMRAMIVAHPHAVLYGSGFTTVRGDEPVGRHGVRADELLGREHGQPPPVVGAVDFFRAWSRDHVVHPSGMVVPRHAALAIGGFANGLTHCEDHLFLARMALSGPVVLTSEPLVEYDVAVPGQFVEYWQGPYRERFDVLEYHRFLADELRRHTATAVAPDRARSFVAYARRQLRTAVLQRAYWGNFAAVSRLWAELRLADLQLGRLPRACAWIARQPALQPPLGMCLRVARGLRGSLARVRQEAGSA